MRHCTQTRTGPAGQDHVGTGARRGVPKGHSRSSRMTLASTTTRAAKLTPATPARNAEAPGRHVPSWPQRHTLTFRGCSRCSGGCPESRSSRLRWCSPSWTRCRSCRRAWLTAGGAQEGTHWVGLSLSFPKSSKTFLGSMPHSEEQKIRVPGYQPPIAPAARTTLQVPGLLLIWLRVQFWASPGARGLSWKWKGAPWGGKSSSMAPRRRPEPRSGALHKVPPASASSGA